MPALGPRVCLNPNPNRRCILHKENVINSNNNKRKIDLTVITITKFTSTTKRPNFTILWPSIKDFKNLEFAIT
jgi:hypothetical protein